MASRTKEKLLEENAMLLKECHQLRIDNTYNRSQYERYYQAFEDQSSERCEAQNENYELKKKLRRERWQFAIVCLSYVVLAVIKLSR